jgi:peptide/nickel transport system ATP-binding protein
MPSDRRGRFVNQFLVRLEDVELTHQRSGRPVRALRGVSLRVDPGACIGVIGASGSGKSSLARVLLGLTPPTRGRRILGHPSIRLHAVFQDPAGSLNPALDIRRILSEPLLARSRPPLEEVTRVAGRALVEVGLDESFLSRRPRQLSGGEQQRVAIARALLADPDLLVLDEPVSALDALARHGVLQLIEALRERDRPALVVISHDLRDVERATDRVVVLSDGRIVESGATAEVIEHPRHPFTQAVVAHR